MAITPKNNPGGVPNTPKTDNDLKWQSQQLGLLGTLFGDRDHAPVYIAAAIVLMSMTGIILVAFVPHTSQLQDADLIKTLGGLVVSSLTFLGGYMSGRTR
ncbi:hypothetical protein [Methylobacterium sp. JK268]